MGTLECQLTDLVTPAVEVLGFELWGVELERRGNHSLLRVYIDSGAGITVDDCARVSHQISGVLDVADPISGPYTLEVSSPGLDRVLFSARQFERHAGATVRVRLRAPVRGRRRLSGELKGVCESEICIEEDGVEWRIPLTMIGTARLVPE